MQKETLEQAEKLKSRIVGLNDMALRMDLMKNSTNTYIGDGTRSVEINKIDETGELRRTIMLLVEAKLYQKKARAETEFENL